MIPRFESVCGTRGHQVAGGKLLVACCPRLGAVLRSLAFGCSGKVRLSVLKGPAAAQDQVPWERASARLSSKQCLGRSWKRRNEPCTKQAFYIASAS